MGSGDQRGRDRSVDRRHRGERVHAAGEEDFGLEHIAHTAGDPLVEQDIGDRIGGIAFGEGQQAIDAHPLIGVRSSEIGAETGQRVRCDVRVGAVTLDFGGTETHRFPGIGDDHHSSVASRHPPALTGSVQVPRTDHPHVRSNRDSVAPRDLQVFSVAGHGVDRRSDSGLQPDQTGSVERQHLAADQRSSQRRGAPIDRVALGHGPQSGSSWAEVVTERHIRCRNR